MTKAFPITTDRGRSPNQKLSGGVETWWGQAMQLAPALRKDYGNQFKHVVTVAGPTQRPMVYGDVKIKEQGVYVDPEIIHMLSFDMLRGDSNALADASSIILSASTAKSLLVPPIRWERS